MTCASKEGDRKSEVGHDLNKEQIAVPRNVLPLRKYSLLPRNKHNFEAVHGRPVYGSMIIMMIIIIII